MNALFKILTMSGISVAATVPSRVETCETQFGRADRVFDAYPEVASRTGAPRDFDAGVLQYKNDSSRPVRIIDAASLVPTHATARAHLRSLEDVRRDLPLTLRDRVTSLHRGDVLVTSRGIEYTLGPFAGWGGTTHLFEIANDSRWLVRIPRAATVKWTHPGYSNLEEKTAFYYQAFRDTLERGRSLGLPLLDARVEDGLIFVERFQPFESAIHFAHVFAIESERGSISPDSTSRREKLAFLLRDLSGKPGVEDVFLDGIVWSPRRDAWIMADFANLRDEHVPDGSMSSVYTDLIADARVRFGFAASELPLLISDAPNSNRFTRTRAVSRPFRGVVVPIVTPLKNNHEVDAKGLGKVIDRVISAGIDMIMVLGTTGEYAHLTNDQKVGMIREACQRVGRRASVMVNVSAENIASTLALACEARESGAGAIAMSYFGPDGDAAALENLRRVSAATTLPIFIYNAPGAHQLSAAAVGEASKIPGVVGLKDSGSSLEYFRDVRRLVSDRPDFSILVGSERLFVRAVSEGADGVVSGSANVAPELMLKIYQAASSGIDGEVNQANHEMSRWKSQLDGSMTKEGGFVAFLKLRLLELGLIESATLASTGRP